MVARRCWYYTRGCSCTEYKWDPFLFSFFFQSFQLTRTPIDYCLFSLPSKLNKEREKREKCRGSKSEWNFRETAAHRVCLRHQRAIFSNTSSKNSFIVCKFSGLNRAIKRNRSSIRNLIIYRGSIRKTGKKVKKKSEKREIIPLEKKTTRRRKRKPTAQCLIHLERGGDTWSNWLCGCR